MVNWCRRRSPVYHTDGPPLCTARWARGTASRGVCQRQWILVDYPGNAEGGAENAGPETDGPNSAES